MVRNNTSVQKGSRETSSRKEQTQTDISSLDGARNNDDGPNPNEETAEEWELNPIKSHSPPPVVSRSSTHNSRRSSVRRGSMQLSATLSPTIYSIVYVCHVRSHAFYMSLFIFCFQVTFPITVLMDLINTSKSGTGTNNVLSIPPDIRFEVRMAAYLSLVLAVPYFRDTLDAVEKLQEGYNPIVLKQSQFATRRKWLLGALMQLGIGLLFNTAIFLLIVQGSNVISMFLNFAALAFITEIDELAFNLASRGFFTESMQQACAVVQAFETPDSDNLNFKRVFLMMTTLGFLAGYSKVAIAQNNGKFLCNRIEVQFGDSYYPYAPYYSGVYFKDEGLGRVGRRLVYSSETDGAAFRYCLDDFFWSWTDVPYLEEEDQCSNWIARSPTTRGFDLVSIPTSDWRISTSNTSNIVYPMDHFVLRCVDCDDSNCAGDCIDNRCVCREGQTGPQCADSTEDVCPVLDKDPNTVEFPQDDGSFLGTKYTVLLGRDAMPVLVYGKPVYYFIYDYTGDPTDDVVYADVLVFMGYRYYAGFIQDAQGLDYTLETYTLAMVEFFQSFTFDVYYVEYLFSYCSPFEERSLPFELHFFFASDPFEVGQPSNQITPTNKRWFKVSRDTPLDDDIFLGGQVREAYCLEDFDPLVYSTGGIETGTVLICAGASCSASQPPGTRKNPCPTLLESEETFCHVIQEYAFDWAILSNSSVDHDFNEFCDCHAYSLAMYEEFQKVDGNFSLPIQFYGPRCRSRRYLDESEDLLLLGLNSTADDFEDY